jgi:hypothetical protein
MTDAVRAFLVGICNDKEIAALEDTDFHERWADGIPDMLVGFQNLQAETSLQNSTASSSAHLVVALDSGARFPILTGIGACRRSAGAALGPSKKKNRPP